MGLLDAWARRIGRNAAKKALDERKPEIAEMIFEAMKPALEKKIKETVGDLYRTSPRFRFIKYMQAELLRVDPAMGGKRSYECARNTLNQWLKDEKIEFGDERYVWGREGAVELIRAYEIEYWEEPAHD